MAAKCVIKKFKHKEVSAFLKCPNYLISFWEDLILITLLSKELRLMIEFNFLIFSISIDICKDMTKFLKNLTKIHQPISKLNLLKKTSQLVPQPKQKRLPKNLLSQMLLVKRLLNLQQILNHFFNRCVEKRWCHNSKMMIWFI